MNFVKKKENIWIIVFFALSIFIVFVFFRSYNLSARIGFGWDQERDAWAVTNILSGKLTLLGPRVQGPSGFFLPPYFFYMIAPFYALSGLSPFAMMGFVVFWSTLFFAISYFVVSKVFDKKIAIYFLALWAVNPLAVSIDTIAWNPVVIPFILILLIYLIYLNFKNPKVRYLLLAGIIFGLGISFHLQFLFIFPIFIPLLINLIKVKRLKGLLYLITGSILPFLPILIFDLRHNFLNISQIIEFIKSGSGGLNRVLSVWDRASSLMIGSSSSTFLGPLIYLLVLIGLFVFARKLHDSVQGKILSSLGFVWLAGLPLFYIFVKNPSEYYFNYLLIPFLVLISLFLKNLKRWGILVLIVIAIYFIIQASPLLRSVSLSLKEKDQTVYALSKITKNSSPFNVSFDVPFNEDTGFRYLLKYYKVPVSGSSADPLIEFVIPYQKRPNTFVFGHIGIYIPSGWLKNNWPEKSE
jgi:4-amino-4-deoxy-L-arabinose transferase-like glycosyltransferase